MELSLRLASLWRQPKTVENLQEVTKVFLHYPLEAVERCVDPMRGIARTKAPNGEVRSFPPSVSEIIHFLDTTPLDSYRPPPPPPPEPPKPPASAENKARVAKLIADMQARRKKEDQEYRKECQDRLDARREDLERRRAANEERKRAERVLAHYQRERSAGEPIDDPDMTAEKAAR